LNCYTHVQSAHRDDPLPAPVQGNGYAQPEDSELQKLSPECAIPACVAQLYRQKQAFDTDRKGVQAAIDKEQRKLIDVPPLGKHVFSEKKGDIVDRSVLRKRAAQRLYLSSACASS
jgi:hypothetical protein